MPKILVEFVITLAVLAGCCRANEDASCTSTSDIEGNNTGLGQSLLQAKTKSQVALQKVQHKSSLDHSRAVAEARRHGEKPLLGSVIPPGAMHGEKSFQTITATRCHLQMELFIRRVIPTLGLELCNEVHLLGMVPLYATGETGTRSYAQLINHIKATVYDPKCKMTAPIGSCPAQQSGCVEDPAPASHRRRACMDPTQRQDPVQKQQGTYPCPLPEGAMWCQVRLKNLPPFFMATYDTEMADDWVSYNVCQAGYWEEDDMSEFGPPGSMLDIGGNIGYHTFSFAQAGWKVSTFEPMLPNLALITATMCRNPNLAANIQLNRHGLGTANENCKMIAPAHNVGDGFVKCGEAETPQDWTEIGKFDIRRLDEVLAAQGINKVDLVKIDVEGYEAQVFAGAPNFLAQYAPRIIKSEVWNQMANATGDSYLDMFENAGYKFFRDSKCQIPMDARKEVKNAGADVVLCKT